MRILIGGDFNLSLNTGDRGRVFQDLCREYQPTIANQNRGAAEAKQLTFRSSLGALRRIDYIVYGGGVDQLKVEANNDIDLGSDYRCVMAHLRLSIADIRVRSRKKKTL